MPGGNKKVAHTQSTFSAAGLFKDAWPFCYHKTLTG